MARFDALIAELSQRFDLGNRTQPLFTETLRAVTSETAGGLAGFVDRFRQAGLGALVASWIGPSDNQPLQPSQMEAALGSNFVPDIARRMGTAASGLVAPIAFLIPRIVDLLTPGGTMPATLPADARALLATSPAVSTTPAKSSSTRVWWIPALIALLAIAAYLSWQRPTEKMTATSPGPAPATVSAPATATAPAKLSITNTDGQIRYDGTVGTEQARDSVLAALKQVFGEANISGSLTINPASAPAEWLQHLSDALAALKIPGIEAIFEGKSISLGGLANDQLGMLMERLKAIFGPDFTYGSLLERAAAAIAQARDRTLAGIAGLQAGFSSQDLVKALNLAIINFESDSATVAADGRDLLTKIATAIKAAPPTSVIEIDGHTDSTGDPAANQVLSEQRATAVRAILIENGVSPTMLMVKGFGDSRPIASNDTPDGRFTNRRIEFVVIQ